MNERDKKLKPYLEAIPDIIKYQLATKLMLAILLCVLGRLFRILLKSTGRVAVSSGDFIFLFTTWQGILIILIALITLFFYVALDINAKIIMSKDLLYGEDVNVWKSIDEALKGVFRLFNPKGISVILYITLVAPLVGIGLSISLTRGFRIPTFIASVVASTPMYLIPASIVAILFVFIGIAIPHSSSCQNIAFPVPIQEDYAIPACFCDDVITRINITGHIDITGCAC